MHFVQDQPGSNTTSRNAGRHPNLPPWLDGLDVRIAKVLVWQGFKSKREVADVLESGDFVPRIGPHSMAVISAWLTAAGIHHEIKANAPRVEHSASIVKNAKQASEGRINSAKKRSGRPLNTASKSVDQIERSRSASKLLDFLIAHLKLKNDRALARELGVLPSTISKLRGGHASVSPGLWICMHETTGISINELKSRL